MPRKSPYFLVLPLIGCLSQSDPADPVIETRGGVDTVAYGDFDLQARGFERFEGRMVHLRLGYPRMSKLADERETFARARVSGGAFRFAIADACEQDIYKWYGLYFDADGDGKCLPGKDEGYVGATDGGGLADSLQHWQIRPADSSVCGFMDGTWPSEIH